jgi:hypothetical protein
VLALTGSSSRGRGVADEDELVGAPAGAAGAALSGTAWTGWADLLLLLGFALVLYTTVFPRQMMDPSLSS